MGKGKVKVEKKEVIILSLTLFVRIIETKKHHSNIKTNQIMELEYKSEEKLSQ